MGAITTRHGLYWSCRLDSLAGIIAPTDPNAGPKAFQDVRNMVKQLPQPISEARLPLLDNAGEELEQARENVEKWFDASMDRVSGWYTRKMAVITLCFAVAAQLLHPARQ
jgi:hypothetical protein